METCHILAESKDEWSNGQMVKWSNGQRSGENLVRIV